HSPKSTFIASRDNRGGFFTLMILPPKDLSDAPRQPLEMVFTLDTSGSMSGRPIEQSKMAMNYALTHMNSADSFQIINFSDRPTKFAQAPIADSSQHPNGASAHRPDARQRRNDAGRWIAGEPRFPNRFAAAESGGV